MSLLTSTIVAALAVTTIAGWSLAPPETKHKILARGVGFESAVVLPYKPAAKSLLVFVREKDVTRHEAPGGKLELEDVARGTVARISNGFHGPNWSECVARANARREFLEETGYALNERDLEFIGGSGAGVTITTFPVACFLYRAPANFALGANSEFFHMTELERIDDTNAKAFRKYNIKWMQKFQDDINIRVGWDAVKLGK